jgi:DNA-binding NtrC family response regulator
VAFPPEYNKQLPIHLGKTPAESDRDLLYWAILEVARDIKELKAFLMHQSPTSTMRPLPIFHPDQVPIDPVTEVEYTEASSTYMEEDIRPLQDVERDTIIKALRATGGHRKKAAERLGMAERTLYRKIQQYNL